MTPNEQIAELMRLADDLCDPASARHAAIRNKIEAHARKMVEGEPVAWVKHQKPYRPKLHWGSGRPWNDGDPDMKYQPLYATPQPAPAVQAEPQVIAAALACWDSLDAERDAGWTEAALHDLRKLRPLLLMLRQPPAQPTAAVQAAWRAAMLAAIPSKFIFDEGGVRAEYFDGHNKAIDDVNAALRQALAAKEQS